MLVHTPKDIAHYFRDQRKSQSLSQTNIAKEIAVRQDTVSSFENKPDKVRLETLLKLLSALDLELHILPKNKQHINNEYSQWNEAW